MASNLLAMASNQDGLQPASDGLQPTRDGLQPTINSLQPNRGAWYMILNIENQRKGRSRRECHSHDQALWTQVARAYLLWLVLATPRWISSVKDTEQEYGQFNPRPPSSHYARFFAPKTRPCFDVGTRTLLVAKGIATRSKGLTSNKKPVETIYKLELN